MHPDLIFLTLLGHAFLWIGLVNRLHAVGIRRWIIKAITAVFFACAVLIPIGAAWRYATVGSGSLSNVLSAYIVLCWIVGPATLLRLAWLRFRQRRPPIVRFHGRRWAEINPAAVAATASELFHHPLTYLPLNEVLRLEMTEWTLDAPRLPPALDGLSIVHLSDLHFTGQVSKAYFREVMRIANALQPDLMCITGDIVDRKACIDWIPDTLGRLTARYGVYFILGNHDLAVDAGRLRRTLEQSGLVNLGGRWLPIDVRGAPILLAGNERPWFKQEDRHSCLSEDTHSCLSPGRSVSCASNPFRIVLAHSPDQLGWARQHDADLLLVGHTHGGQIRIPPLGAVFSPTSAGVKYISGVYHVPPTILHVNRGLSGDTPIRWNCPPEITLLRLAHRAPSR